MNIHSQWKRVQGKWNVYVWGQIENEKVKATTTKQRTLSLNGCYVL